jgi:pentatricopeptide repeat protein
MKKRGQQPDAHTFTIIIRGCTDHRDLPAALGKVMAIYSSMSADKSPVKPNTIHMNAILKMCARAGDMDAMFGIVAQMPTKGIAAPNNLTYTTIINALRTNAIIDLRGTLTPVQKRQNVQKAILNARQMWQDITNRWRKGDMWIDEELVCSMGRLLLIGGERDCDDILSLIEQTMNIPRQIPKMGTPGRKAIEPSSQGRVDVDEPEVVPATEASEESVESEESIIEAMKTARIDSFASISPPSAPLPSTSAYAKPGRNSLSLVMEALLKLKLKEPAYKYWDIFVRNIGVKPDVTNYHAYFRILRVARASSETVALLERLRQTEMRAATFRIAMASCDRDKNNPNAFANAGKILDIMTTALQVPDVPVLITYLDVAISSTSGLSKLASGKQILRALERLGPSFINIKSLLNYGPPSGASMTKAEQEDFQTSVVTLARRMVGAYDLLMDKGLVERDTYSTYTAERSKLAAFAQRRDSPRSRPTGNFEIPAELQNFIDTHRLNKIMVHSQTSSEKWKIFVERIKKDYETEQKLMREAQAMQQESAATKEAEKIAAEERQFAEIMAKEIGSGPLYSSVQAH